MKIAAQIFVSVVSLVTVWWLNALSAFALTQVHRYTRHLFNGKPLPALTEFFVGHAWLPVHASFLLWLGFVGAPLLRLSWARNYWEPTAFMLRYLVFFSCELLLYLVLLVALVLPFITIYQCLEGGGSVDTEQTVAWWVLWTLVAVTILAAVWRCYQIRKLRC